jgi:hypothetical protein
VRYRRIFTVDHRYVANASDKTGESYFAINVDSASASDKSKRKTRATAHKNSAKNVMFAFSLCVKSDADGSLRLTLGSAAEDTQMHFTPEELAKIKTAVMEGTTNADGSCASQCKFGAAGQGQVAIPGYTRSLLRLHYVALTFKIGELANRIARGLHVGKNKSPLNAVHFVRRPNPSRMQVGQLNMLSPRQCLKVVDLCYNTFFFNP